MKPQICVFNKDSGAGVREIYTLRTLPPVNRSKLLPAEGRDYSTPAASFWGGIRRWAYLSSSRKEEVRRGDRTQNLS